MSTIVLSINAGSSSLKTTLYVYGKEQVLRSLAKAEISNINSPPAQLKYSSGTIAEKKDVQHVKDHKTAFVCALESFLNDSNIEQFKSKDDIQFACHRVVQGGDFEENQLITHETFHKIESLEDLAPLHNKSAVDLMVACHEHLPKVTNVACFDSAFHHTMPQHVKSYMIDQKIAREKGLRKYGFHGLSYSYITRTVAMYLQKPAQEINLIALHLGSGASICAIRDGQSIDTSMGLTPVSGLPGGSRSGDIDPALIFHYTSNASKLSPSSTKDLHISTAEEILNTKSGWKAVAGTSDFAEIAKANPSAEQQLALDIFVDRIVGYLGAYYVKLEGKVDAIVFAGGIGERSALLRKMVVERVACLGFAIDKGKNDNLGLDSVTEVGEQHGRKVLVCATDEDYEMAYSTMQRSI